jgi:hypothetical protein
MANRADAILIQLCVGHLDAAGPPSFGSAVGVVGPLVAEEQMGRIDAGRGVTGMKNMSAIGDWAVGQLPRKPMSENRSLSANCKLTVATGVEAANPNPALFRLDDFFPESVGWVSFDATSPATAGAEATATRRLSGNPGQWIQACVA